MTMEKEEKESQRVLVLSQPLEVGLDKQRSLLLVGRYMYLYVDVEHHLSSQIDRRSCLAVYGLGRWVEGMVQWASSSCRCERHILELHRGPCNSDKKMRNVDKRGHGTNQVSMDLKEYLFDIRAISMS